MRDLGGCFIFSQSADTAGCRKRIELKKCSAIGGLRVYRYSSGSGWKILNSAICPVFSILSEYCRPIATREIRPGDPRRASEPILADNLGVQVECSACLAPGFIGDIGPHDGGKPLF